MNIYYVAGIPYSDELYHHGIKGQKWGIRRYQNPDGSLTEAGLRRYGTVENFNNHQKMKESKKEWYKSQLKAGLRVSSPIANLTKSGREKTKSAIQDMNKKGSLFDKLQNKAKKSDNFKNVKKNKEDANKRHNEKVARGKSIAKSMIMGGLHTVAAYESYKIATDPRTPVGIRAVSAFLSVANAKGAGDNFGYAAGSAYNLSNNKKK